MSILSTFLSCGVSQSKDDETALDAQKYIKGIAHAFPYVDLRGSEKPIGLPI